MGMRDYDKQLSALEKKRLLLEDERNNLHASFAMRMESIKLQHAEAVMRAGAMDLADSSSKSPLSPNQAPFRKSRLPPPSTPTNSVKSRHASSSVSSSSTVTSSLPGGRSRRSTPKGTPKSINQREWVSSKYDSKKSFNVVLKKKAELSERRTHDMNSPDKLRSRMLDCSDANGTTRLLRSSTSHTENLSSEEAWSLFLNVLNTKDQAWGTESARIRKSASQEKSKSLGISVSHSHSLLGESVISGGAEKRHDEPMKPQSIQSLAIRREELAAMFAEDKRRQLWMKQNSLSQVESDYQNRRSVSDVNKSLLSMPGSPSMKDSMRDMLKMNESKLGSLRGADTSASGEGGDTNAISRPTPKSTLDFAQFAPKDTEQAFKWLNAARQFLLVDRIAKTQYFFQLTKEHTHSGENKDKNKTNTSFLFTWKEKIHASEPSGSINLDLVRSVAVNPNNSLMFCLSILNTPQSLLTTGGRTSLSILCGSEIECQKYIMSLKLLLTRSNTKSPNSSSGAVAGSGTSTSFIFE